MKFNSGNHKKYSPERKKLYTGINDFAFHKQRIIISILEEGLYLNILWPSIKYNVFQLCILFTLNLPPQIDIERA